MKVDNAKIRRNFNKLKRNEELSWKYADLRKSSIIDSICGICGLTKTILEDEYNAVQKKLNKCEHLLCMLNGDEEVLNTYFNFRLENYLKNYPLNKYIENARAQNQLYRLGVKNLKGLLSLSDKQLDDSINPKTQTSAIIREKRDLLISEVNRPSFVTEIICGKGNSLDTLKDRLQKIINKFNKKIPLIERDIACVSHDLSFSKMDPYYSTVLIKYWNLSSSTLSILERMKVETLKDFKDIDISKVSEKTAVKEIRKKLSELKDDRVTIYLLIRKNQYYFEGKNPTVLLLK